MPRMYFVFLAQMKKHLGQFDKWFDAIDANVFLDFRLAPDQFPLKRQVVLACGSAVGAAAWLAGREPRSFPDDQKTIEELRVLVKSVIAYLDDFTEKQFEGAATRSVSHARWKGKTMTGHDYFVEHAQPNFFFHVAHTYAILRHNLVPLGKRDYLGPVTMREPS
jgi:hypothetical protein